MKLIIFDLDQTLVDLISIHDEAVNKLFRALFGVEARLTDIDFAGRSLDDNFAELARLKSVPPDIFRNKKNSLIQDYDKFFAQSMPHNASRYILPGALKVLERLLEANNILALYTGDSPAVVARVFQATGLGKYFKFCLYGTEIPVRSAMIRVAVQRAQELTGRKFEGKNVVVIGDSIRDIEAGKQVNALTIVVATGFHSREKLEAARPDYLFNNMEDKDALLEAIGS